MTRIQTYALLLAYFPECQSSYHRAMMVTSIYIRNYNTY